MLLYVRLWNLLDTLYMLVHNYDGDWTIGGEGWVGGRSYNISTNTSIGTYLYTPLPLPPLVSRWSVTSTSLQLSVNKIVFN